MPIAKNVPSPTHLVREVTPEDFETEIGGLWSDTATLVLKLCTALSPLTFTQVGGGGPGGDHNLLSATHLDTLAASVARGNLLYGNATPKWAALALGGANTILRSDGTDLAWKSQSFIDHGAIGGLGDDDHTQYHNDARALTWHGTLSGAHVTNGDSHDHAGGDGAQIDHGGLAGLGDDDHTIYLLANGSRQASKLGVNVAVSTDVLLQVGGSIITSGEAYAALVNTTIEVTGSAKAYTLYVDGSFVESTAGTHPNMAAARFGIASVSDNLAATTQIDVVRVMGNFTAPSGTTTANALYVSNAPSGATTNWALNVAAGNTRLAGRVAINSNGFGNQEILYIAPDSTPTTSASAIVPGVNVASIANLNVTGQTGEVRLVQVQSSTLIADSSTTVPLASTVHIHNAPVAGTNVTITDTYALRVLAGNVRFDAARVIIGADVVNTFATGPSLYIDQGAYDDFGFIAASSDVAHGGTSVLQADSYFGIQKYSATDGGARLLGGTETQVGLCLEALVTTAVSTKGTGQQGAVRVLASKINAGARGGFAAGENLFCVADYTVGSVLITDQTGDTWLKNALYLASLAGAPTTTTDRLYNVGGTLYWNGALVWKLGADGDKGDITLGGSGSTLTIDNDAVTYAKMQNISATQRVLGRNTAGAGDTEEAPPPRSPTGLGPRRAMCSIGAPLPGRH